MRDLVEKLILKTVQDLTQNTQLRIKFEEVTMSFQKKMQICL